MSTRWTKEPHWLTIVGVVSDLKEPASPIPDSRTVYARRYVQRVTEWQRWGTIVLKGRVEPHALVAPLKRAVWAVDPTLTLDQIQTIEERRSVQTAQQRFNALALAAFAAVALLVALQGVYALLAYAVEERRREFGVRIALGASTRDLLRLVVGRGLRPGGAGARPGPGPGRGGRARPAQPPVRSRTD